MEFMLSSLYRAAIGHTPAPVQPECQPLLFSAAAHTPPLTETLAQMVAAFNVADHVNVLSPAEMANDMRTEGAPYLPSYLERALTEEFPDQETLNQLNAQATAPIADAITELFSDLSEVSAHHTFLRALQAQEDPSAAAAYLFRAQRDADYKTVDLQIEGQHTPFNLYNYRPAPFVMLLQQTERYPLLNNLIEDIQTHFLANGIRVGAAKASPGDDAAAGVNPLRNSWGVFEDRQGYQLIGFFDDAGLLQGPGMVINDAYGSVLTGSHFEAGCLEGLGVFVGSNTRFYGEYVGGRGNGVGLVASALGETISIGPVIDGQIQMLTRLDQDDVSQSDAAQALVREQEEELERQTYEIGDYVDGTIDHTVEFEALETPVKDIATSLGLPFIPQEYRPLHRKQGKNVSAFHVLALPCAVYIGIRQTKIALIHEWTHKNGVTRQEPLRTPTLVSTRLTRAVATLNEKDKAKKGSKG